MIFRHLVGKSTLKEGITVHKNFEIFFDSPDSGHKKEIVLLFGDNQSAKVILRRLNNKRNHVQIKYTCDAHVPFINWLNAVFVATRKGTVGEFLEFQKISYNIFMVKPITIGMSHNAKLYIADSIFHKTNEEALKDIDTFSEIEKIISSIGFRVDENQTFYNLEIKKAFTNLQWDKEGRAIPELDIKYDFRKNAIQVEVEFGNARSYYQDYIKFMLSYLSKEIKVGLLITPTLGFASILCEIGKQKAIQRGRKSYSGMMQFEKAQKELSYLIPIFDMPIGILGIDVNPS